MATIENCIHLLTVNVRKITKMISNNSIPADKATNHPNKTITVEQRKIKHNALIT